MASKRKKLKTSNRVLLAIGIFIVAFIISMEVIFCVTGSVPDTLIQYTLGAGKGRDPSHISTLLDPAAAALSL